MVNHSVRSMLDSDIHDSRCAVAVPCSMCTQCAWVGFNYKSIHGVTWLCVDPLPDIKTRVVTDRRTDGQMDG